MLILLNPQGIGDTYGFSRHDKNILFSILTNKNSYFDYLEVLKNGTAIFPADFSNKRQYLEFYKKHKNEIDNDIFQFHLYPNMVEILRRLVNNNYLFIDNIDNLSDICIKFQQQISFPKIYLKQLTDRSIFQAGIFYQLMVNEQS